MRIDTPPYVSPAGVQTLTNKTITSPTMSGTVAYGDNAPNIAPKARAYLGTLQENLGNDAATKVLLDTENYDIGSDFDTGNNRFVAPVTGYYLVAASVRYLNTSVVADKRYHIMIYVNQAEYSVSVSQSSYTDWISATLSDIVPVTAGQYIELYARQASGGATVDVNNGTTQTFMAVHLISV